VPPQLQNTDGDPLLLTTDHFDIAPGAKRDIERKLAAWPDVDPPEPGEDPPAYVFLRPKNRVHPDWENTVIGRALFAGGSMTLETNSRERADALRARLEAAFGKRIRHRDRMHHDLLSAGAGKGVSGPAPVPNPPSPEMEQLALEYKQRHYADWVDHPLPALEGKTPREAVRSPQGRTAVDVLLKDMENREQRSSQGPPFDFGEIRRRLGLK